MAEAYEKVPGFRILETMIRNGASDRIDVAQQAAVMNDRCKISGGPDYFDSLGVLQLAMDLQEKRISFVHMSVIFAAQTGKLHSNAHGLPQPHLDEISEQMFQAGMVKFNQPVGELSRRAISGPDAGNVEETEAGEPEPEIEKRDDQEPEAPAAPVAEPQEPDPWA